MIVAAFKNGVAKGVISRDVDTAFVGKDAGFELPVREPRTEGERDVLMHGLKSLEDKGVTCGGRFNAMREGGVDQVNEEGRWEEGDIGVIRVIRGKEIRAAGEGVGASEKLPRDMDHFEVKVSKINEPTCLAAVKRLGLAEIG